MSGIKNLTIVQMDDSHAYFDLYQEMFWRGDYAVYCPAGGHARIATIVKQIRAEAQGQCKRNFDIIVYTCEMGKELPEVNHELSL